MATPPKLCPSCFTFIDGTARICGCCGAVQTGQAPVQSAPSGRGGPTSHKRLLMEQRSSAAGFQPKLRAFGDVSREIRLDLRRFREWLADNRHHQLLAAAVVMFAVAGAGTWVWQAVHPDDLAADLRRFDVASATARAETCSSADATIAYQKLDDAGSDYTANNDIGAERAIAMSLHNANVPSCARAVRDLDVTWMLFLASIRARIHSGATIANLDELHDLAEERGADLARLESVLQEQAGASDAAGHD